MGYTHPHQHYLLSPLTLFTNTINYQLDVTCNTSRSTVGTRFYADGGRKAKLAKNRVKTGLAEKT